MWNYAGDDDFSSIARSEFSGELHSGKKTLSEIFVRIHLPGCLYSEKLWEKLLLTRNLHYRKPLLKTLGKRLLV